MKNSKKKLKDKNIPKFYKHLIIQKEIKKNNIFIKKSVTIFFLKFKNYKIN